MEVDAKQLHSALSGRYTDFSRGWHEAVPWPELLDSRPSFCCLGRPSVALITGMLRRCFNYKDLVLTGSLGGKSHLLAMAVCEHYQSGLQETHRIVALLFHDEVPTSPSAALELVIRALLLAYADDEGRMRVILDLRSWQHVGSFLMFNRPVLVVDRWEEIELGNGEVHRRMVELLRMTTFLKCVNCSSSQARHMFNDPTEFYNVFSPDETLQYLGKWLDIKRIDEELLRRVMCVTGGLPLFVWYFVESIMQANNKGSSSSSSSGSQLLDWRAAVRGFMQKEWVAKMRTTIASCEDTSRFARFVSFGLQANTGHCSDIDIRFLVRDSKWVLHPVSDYARDIYWTCLQRRKLLHKCEPVLCNAVYDSLRDVHGNTDRFEWLLKKLIIGAFEDTPIFPQRLTRSRQYQPLELFCDKIDGRVSGVKAYAPEADTSLPLVDFVVKKGSSREPGEEITLGRISAGSYAYGSDDLVHRLPGDNIWTPAAAKACKWKFVWILLPWQIQGFTPRTHSFLGGAMEEIAVGLDDVAKHLRGTSHDPVSNVIDDYIAAMRRLIF
ncbi:hypothetical protein SELMODRAFT_421276 [Selaginella moellendorffii]|uniref:Uncharacterized protein n=1 Tax=Selaginella moellendorffii TaxID=88036 RepID=D8SEQ5_SELML|nr:uncharacterized protein LOC9633934 [Selaginella moellendorffii]EFJ16913.1 hypothetical protein SELMODRAFT_421276 [Selaginella moellendorffii]|eukprot:XP_002981820.1 uncharacterized protein LOC9633934 [Selaginella moellendorffii]